MNFVIPMAGLGSRFRDAGYSLPKPLLPAHGKTLLEWSVDSLPLALATRLVFVGLKEHRDRYGLEDFISQTYADYDPQFVWLDATTRGQAETVYLAAPLLDPSVGLLIFNIDTAFHSPTLASLLANPQHDGVLGAFPSQEPRFSYARLGDDGHVAEVREKTVISHHALTGLYHFSSTAAFLEIAGQALEQDDREMGEFYVAPLYNRLIDHGARFVVDPTPQHWILGTPSEYEHFLQNPPSIRSSPCKSS
jgi:NDP-sugar pyrophosphorylase family protein